MEPLLGSTALSGRCHSGLELLGLGRLLLEAARHGKRLVQDVWVRVWSLGLRVQGLGFGVQEILRTRLQGYLAHKKHPPP